MSDVLERAREAGDPAPAAAPLAGALSGLWQRFAETIGATYRAQAYPLGYSAGLDGMRAAITLAVILFHTRPAWTPGGFVAMEGFFLLSGYFITGLLLREHARAGRVRVRDFYRRRIARIFPPLLAMLAAFALAAAIGLTDAEPRRVAAALGYVVFGWSWWPRIGPPVEYDLGHLWSIAIELQFYFVWPWIVLGLLRALGRGARLAAVMLALAAASWGYRAWLCWEGAGTTLLYAYTFARLDALLVGSALAAMLPEMRMLSRDAVARWAAAGAWIALALFLAGILLARPSARWYYYFGSVALGIVPAALALVVLLRSERTVLHRVLEWPILVFLGHIFYALYLWHFPVIAIAAENHVPRTPVALPITLLAAVLSYLLIERHFMRRRAGA